MHIQLHSSATATQRIACARCRSLFTSKQPRNTHDARPNMSLVEEEADTRLTHRT
jgi:hypothetical protein